MKNNAQFSVAMSQETGCIVMVRSNGKKVTVIGSLTKEQTEGLCKSCTEWKADAEPPQSPVTELPSRRLYPH